MGSTRSASVRPLRCCRLAWLLPMLLFSRALSAQPAPLQWPLDLTPALSSTFGETRSTSFHAGIDLKTWGKTGYEVRAVADGWVERLRTSPWGYGRVIYQRLDDGRIVVYAHLQGFFPPAAERVRAEQQAARRYTVDLWLKEGEIPVQRGQVIARTGQSGAGPPHLHLEVRDAGSAPVNPLLQGLGPVQDTTRPTLRRLIVVPIGPQSTVDGGLVPVTVPLRLDAGTGAFLAAREVVVWGRIGLGIDSHDRADAATNKMAALRHELRVDGASRFRSQYRRFTYADNHLVSLDRLRPGSDEGVYALLYRRPGNRLSFYETTEGSDGTLDCGQGDHGSGRHRVEVLVADAAGNQSRAVLALRVRPPVRIGWARRTESSEGSYLEADLAYDGEGPLTVVISSGEEGSWTERLTDEVPAGGGPFSWELPAVASPLWRLSASAERGAAQSLLMAAAASGESLTRPLKLEVRTRPRLRHVLVDISSPRPLIAAPEIHLDPGSGRSSIYAQQIEPWRYQAAVPVGGDSAFFDIEVTANDARGSAARETVRLSAQALEPGAAKILTFLDQRIRLLPAAASAYERVYPQAVAFEPSPSVGLRATVLGCDLGPADVAFDKHVWLWMQVPAEEPIDRAGVYADDGRGAWVFLGNERQEGRWAVGARIRALGRFALMIDTTAPEVSDVSPQPGTHVVALPTISAGVHDAGSGIGREEDVELVLDGQRLISEYDPDADRVTARPDGPLVAGSHTLTLTVRDQAGNETRRQVGFRSR